jgi:ABC-type dipeptide/oligopeptide/nickel transport system permease subunit
MTSIDAPNPVGNVDGTAPAEVLLPQSLLHDAWRQLRRSKLALTCGIIVLIYLAVAAVGYTAPQWRNPQTGAIDPSQWFGTDFLGRSVFWRAIYGARVALTVAIWAGLLEVLIGVSLGAIAGYFGGRIDALIVWLFSTMASIPAILLLIAFAYALRNQTISAPWEKLIWQDASGVIELTGVPSIIIALALTSWVGLCRLIRGEVIKHRDRDYIVAARALGAGHLRIIFRHLVPNVFHLVIISFVLSLAGYIQAEVILSFLGLGVTNAPSWGRMIDDAKLELLKNVWWQMTAATGLMFLLCLAANILGDALRDALDPRLRGVD